MLTNLNNPTLYKKTQNALTFTFITNNILLYSQFPHGPIVKFFEGDTQLMDHICTLIVPFSCSASKEHVEYVHGGRHATSPSYSPLFDGLLASEVIDLPLLRIRQNFIGLGNLLELGNKLLLI